MKNQWASILVPAGVLGIMAIALATTKSELPTVGASDLLLQTENSLAPMSEVRTVMSPYQYCGPGYYGPVVYHYGATTQADGSATEGLVQPKAIN